MAELYTLPDGWEWKPLISLTEVFSDGDWIESKDQSDDGIRLIQTGNIGIGIFKDREDKSRFISESTFERLNCTEIYENDCLISRLPEPVGRSCLIPKMDLKLITSVDCTIVRFKESVLPKLFVYYSQSNYYFNMIMNNSTGATRLRISKKNLSNIPIPLPPLSEQQRIVAKLDNLFAKIDKAIALHQKNIDEANVFMASVLNDVFVELEEKYGLIKINDVVVKTKNKNPLNEKDTPFTYIDISSIDNKSFKIVEPKQLIGSEAPSRAKKEVFQGDIVYSTTRPNLKNIAIVSENYNNPIASTGFCVLRTNEKTINSYLFYFLITEKLFEQIEPNIRGAQYPATSDNDLKNCNIPNAPYETQQKVVSYLDEISNKMEKIKQIQKEKMQSLKALKASILDQGFKGEL